MEVRGMADLDETTAEVTAIELTAAERQLLRTALRLLISTLSREEAEELRDAQALLARLA
jgi:hypothetical protein